MQLTLILFPIALAIYGAIIYLFVLLVKALRKYIKSKDVREEKKAVCRSLGEALKTHRTEKQMTQEFDAWRQPSGGQQVGERHVRPQYIKPLRARKALRHSGRRTVTANTGRTERKLSKKKRQPKGCLFFLCTMLYFSSSGSEKSVFKTPE